MNVQAHMSGQFSGQVNNQAGNQLPGVLQQNGNSFHSQMQNLSGQSIPPVMDSEVIRRRRFMREKIYEILMQRQSQPSEVVSRRCLDFTKRLEEGLFKSATTTEEYMNMDTLEARLQALVKRPTPINHAPQQSQFVNNTATVGTMMPTPGLQHNGNSNVMVPSAVDPTMMTTNLGRSVQSSAPTAGNLTPIVNGSFSGMRGGSFRGGEDNMDPGPDDYSVLTLQNQHRSGPIWEGEEYDPFTCRSHLKTLSHFQVPEAVKNYVSLTQFDGIGRICFLALDVDLITALVERWRQETHTFHLPFGEVTVTLQDVAVLFGLRVSGRPVTGTSEHGWANLCEELLGSRPPQGDLQGSKLKMKWLHHNFQNLPNNADEGTVLQFVRAYILYLIGVVLFPDKSGNTVSLIYLPLLRDMAQIDQISWGSGVLACLYRNLCKATKKGVWQIAGPMLLLQLWSWERISISRPVRVRLRVDVVEGQHYPLGAQFRTGLDPLACKWIRVDLRYMDHRLGLSVVRDLLDKMVEIQFVWQPYTDNVLACCSPRCSQDRDEWLVIAPLICFEAVEWHLPFRCVRQFGWHQTIPPAFDTDVHLHSYTRKGDGQNDYTLTHAGEIIAWENRMNTRVQPGLRYSGLMSRDDEYLVWFQSITRRTISPMSNMVNQDYDAHHYYYPTAADFQTLTESCVFGYNTTTTLLNNVPDDMPLAHYSLVEQMNAMHLDALRETRQGHLVNYEEVTEPSPSPPRYSFRQTKQRVQRNPTEEDEEPESSTRRRKKGRNRNQ